MPTIAYSAWSEQRSHSWSSPRRRVRKCPPRDLLDWAASMKTGAGSGMKWSGQLHNTWMHVFSDLCWRAVRWGEVWCGVKRTDWEECKDGRTTHHSTIWNPPAFVLLIRHTRLQTHRHTLLPHFSSSYHMLSSHILNRSTTWEFRFNDKEPGTQIQRSVCVSTGRADNWPPSVPLFSVHLNYAPLILTSNALCSFQIHHTLLLF